MRYCCGLYYSNICRTNQQVLIPDPAPICRARHMLVSHIVAGTTTLKRTRRLHQRLAHAHLFLVVHSRYYAAKKKDSGRTDRSQAAGPLSPRTRRRTAACGICCISAESKTPKLPGRTAESPRTPAAAPSRSARRTAGGMTAFSDPPCSTAKSQGRRRPRVRTRCG